MCRSPRCRRTPTPPQWIWCSRWPNSLTEAGEPAGIGGTVEFRTDVFDAASIEALIERFERVLVAHDRRSDGAVVVGGSAGCR